MTTLTERLRQLENYEDSLINRRATKESAHAVVFSAVAVAQELHALLVECGEALKIVDSKAEAWNDALGLDTRRARITSPVLAKLQQAGIV